MPSDPDRAPSSEPYLRTEPAPGCRRYDCVVTVPGMMPRPGYTLRSWLRVTATIDGDVRAAIWVSREIDAPVEEDGA